MKNILEELDKKEEEKKVDELNYENQDNIQFSESEQNNENLNENENENENG